MIDEDFQAWEAFKLKNNYRWMFNKLEVALRQGLMAGPAATAPKFDGTYIHRPVYNLYGMGIGATKFEYDSSMYSNMINHAIVPPGHFWCEWLEGTHYSIDYEKISTSWFTRSAWVGEHESKDNLTKFKEWTRIDTRLVPTIEEIDYHHIKLPSLHQIDKLNLEMIDGFVIEIHLRWGNDPFDDLQIGDTIIPVWNDDEAPEGEWRGNLHDDMEQYSASGHLTDVRRGYVIRRIND